MVGKIETACKDQTRDTIEVAYPQICQLVETVQNNDACNPKYNPEKIKGWQNGEDDKFSNLILRYTTENIVLVNIYMKDPFAIKYRIDENAPR